MSQEAEEEMVEIDWEPLQHAINVMSYAGLDLEDGEEMAHHLATLLASFLKQQQQANEMSDEDVGELAAWIAGNAAEIAFTVEDLPPFVVDEEDEGYDDEDGEYEEYEEYDEDDEDSDA